MTKTNPMKKMILCSALFMALINVSLQASVDADTVIVVASTQHPLRITIPDDYDPLNSYPLVIGLHYCGGTSDQYRNGLRPMCDSMGVIIACPDNNTQEMTTPGFVLAAIDTVASIFSIDTAQVYLTGMSCNGNRLLHWVLDDNIYPFKGIFPWVPWVDALTSTTFNLDTEIPVVISVGTVDNNITTLCHLYDSLKAHGADVDLVMVKDIAHTMGFATFDEEMIRCMWYLNDTNAITIDPVADFSMYNTDPAVEIKVPVTNLAGRALNFRIISSNWGIIPIPEVSVNETNDTATFTIDPADDRSGKVYLVLEGTEEGGTGIEQRVFRVNVMAIPQKAETIISDEKLEVYPVPADKQLFLRCPEGEVSLQVRAVNGKILFDQPRFNTSSGLDISSLPSGIYLLTAMGKNFTGTVKFIVE